MITFLYILLIIVTIIAFLGFIAPKTFEVKRSILIHKPIVEVFTYLKFLKNQDHWSPWNKKDPNMKKMYTGVDGEIGFVSAWEGNKDVGAGEQELMKIVENTAVYSQLRFLKPWKSTSDAYLFVSAESETTTKVTWGFMGKNKFPFSIFTVFISMDKMMGKDFEEGLQNLKQKLESE